MNPTIEAKVTLHAEVELLESAPGAPDEHYPGWCGPSDSLIRVTIADQNGNPIEITGCLDYEVMQDLARQVESKEVGDATTLRHVLDTYVDAEGAAEQGGSDG